MWIVDRRQQAFEDTSGLRERRPAARAGLLPRLPVQARGGRGRQVRGGLGPEAPARGPAERDPAGARRWAQGHPRRPFRGCLHRGGVRGVGLPRPPGLPRPRRPGADRWRPARQLPLRGPRPGKARAGRDPQRPGSSTTCSELGLPEINGIFAQVGALWAYKRPDEPSVLQQYPALPEIGEAAGSASRTRRCSAMRSTRRPRRTACRSSTSAPAGWPAVGTRAAGSTAS